MPNDPIKDSHCRKQDGHECCNAASAAVKQAEDLLDDVGWLNYMLRLCDVLGIQTDVSRWTLCRYFLEASSAQRLEALRETKPGTPL